MLPQTPVFRFLGGLSALRSLYAPVLVRPDQGMKRDQQERARQIAQRSSEIEELATATFGGPPGLPDWIRERQLDLFGSDSPGAAPDGLH